LGFGISALYPDAWTAWENTEQHTGSIPIGLDVPLYFSYTATIGGIKKNYGHIGVQLVNGKFWSDGTIYPDYKAYTASHSPKYVGWGESVNSVKVIEGEVMPTEKDVRDYFNVHLGKPPSDAQVVYYTARHWRTLIDDVIGSIKRQHAKVQALVDKLNKDLAEVQKRLVEAVTPEDHLNAQTELLAAQARLAELSEQLEQEQAEPNWTWANVIEWVKNKLFRRDK